MDKKMEIHFSTGVKYKDIYYLTAIHMNALFMYDEKKDKLTFLKSFEKELKRESLYLKAFLYKNEAWFIPHRADNIAIVNLDTHFIDYIPLEYHKCYNHEGVKYNNILYFNKSYLCLIPWAVDTVMIIDLRDKNTVSYYDIVDEKRHYQNAIFYDNKIYFFPWSKKDILVLDLKTNKRVKLPQPEEEESFGDVVYDEKSGCLFHAPGKKNYILIDNLSGKERKLIKLDYWDDKKYKTYYSTQKLYNIFFWGYEKNVVIKINKNDNNIKVYTITPKHLMKYFYPIYSNDIEALVYGRNCIIKYNADRDDFSYLYITISPDTLIQAQKAQNTNLIRIDQQKIMQENVVSNLIYFLLYILGITHIRNDEIEKNIGSQIYNKI